MLWIASPSRTQERRRGRSDATSSARSGSGRHSPDRCSANRSGHFKCFLSASHRVDSSRRAGNSCLPAAAGCRCSAAHRSATGTHAPHSRASQSTATGGTPLHEGHVWRQQRAPLQSNYPRLDSTDRGSQSTATLGTEERRRGSLDVSSSARSGDKTGRSQLPLGSTDCSRRADGSRPPNRTPVQRSEPDPANAPEASRAETTEHRAQRVRRSRREGRSESGSGALPGQCEAQWSPQRCARAIQGLQRHCAQLR